MNSVTQTDRNQVVKVGEKKMKNYIAINSYRSSTDNGFSNTWVVYHCSRKDQMRLLREGMPTSDVCGLGPNGEQYPINSTMGIELPSRKQIRELLKRERDGEPRHEIYWFAGDEHCEAGWEKSI